LCLAIYSSRHSVPFYFRWKIPSSPTSQGKKRGSGKRGGYTDLKGKTPFPSESSPHTDADRAKGEATIKRQKPSERKLRPFQESFTDKMIQDHTQVAGCHFPLNPSMRGF